jgi:Trk K+ transport system NAD-binding subunit
VISEEVFEELTAEVDSQLYEGSPSLEVDQETRTSFLEITIPENSHAVDMSIAEIGIPRSAVLVSIKRKDELLIPRGDTILCAGDVVTIFAEREYIDRVRELLILPEKVHQPSEQPAQNDGIN